MDRMAYLSRGDAIDVHLERFGAQIAPDWKTEDLAALFARLRSSHCSIEGIRMFADDFKNTTEEEIMDVIENLKKLINKAEANRFIHRNYEVLGITRTDEVEPSTSNKFADVNYAANASEAASRAASVVKSVHMKRKLRSTASDRIKDVLKEFAKEADAKITVSVAASDSEPTLWQEQEKINFGNIYKYIGEAATFRVPKIVSPLEAAVILDVFNDIQNIADGNFDEHAEYIHQMLKDFETMRDADLRPIETLSDDAIGRTTFNTLNMPKDVCDLSKY